MEVLVKIYAFIFGSLIGSFLNVVILRLPLNKDLVLKRSHCPQCLTQLKWYHNIPIVSFLILKGRCDFCKTRISWRYPTIELLTALISLGLTPNDFDLNHIMFYLFQFSIAAVFIMHFFIDLDHHLLLDSINLYLLAIILSFVLFHFHWTYWLVGGAVGFLVPLIVTWLFYKLRGQIGLGGGDIKLFGILGLLLGAKGIMFTIFLSCLVGALLGVTFILTKKLTKDHPMAFGPSIILVASFQIYFPNLASGLQNWFFF